MNFGATKVEGRAFMEMAAEKLGLSPNEGRQAYDGKFPEFKQEMLSWIAEQAEIHMVSAINKAEEESARHSSYLDESWRDHEALMQKLAERAERSVPEDAGDDFVKLIKSSDEALAQHAEQGSKDLLEIVQAMHRLRLQHCFTSHLVSPKTANDLAAYYEVCKNK
jgi:hypothetical protein